MTSELSCVDHIVACGLSDIKQKVDKLLSELLEASNAFATCYNKPNGSLDKAAACLAHDILGMQVIPKVEKFTSATAYHNNKVAHLNASVGYVKHALKVHDKWLITAHLRYQSLMRYLLMYKVLSDLHVPLRTIAHRFTALEEAMQDVIGIHPMRQLLGLHKGQESVQIQAEDFAETYDKATFMHASLSDLITSIENLVEHLRALSLSVRQTDVKQQLSKLASAFEYERSLFLNENTAIFYMVKNGENAAVDVGEAKLLAAVEATVRILINGLINIESELMDVTSVAMETGTHSAEQQCLTTLMTIKYVIDSMVNRHGLLSAKQREQTLHLKYALDKIILESSLAIDRNIVKY